MPGEVFVAVKSTRTAYSCFHCDLLPFLTTGLLYFTDTSHCFPDYSTDPALDSFLPLRISHRQGRGEVLSVKTRDREGEAFGENEAFGCTPTMSTLLNITLGCSWEEAKGTYRRAAWFPGSEPSVTLQSRSLHHPKPRSHV